MKMKLFKNNLDEMQEKKLLKIEHNGMWIAFWGLFAALLLQAAFGADFKQFMGEFIVLMVLCCYMAVATIKNGIWDRRLKANLKTNALLSIFAAVIVAAVDGIIFYRAGMAHSYLAISVSIAAIFTYLLCLGVLQLSLLIYKKRKEKLESETEE